MAPIAILASNALALVGLVAGRPFLCQELVVRCKRLVIAGEVLEIKLRRVAEGERFELLDATHVIELIDEQNRHVGSMLARIKYYPVAPLHL